MKIVCFDAYELDVEAGELRRNGIAVKLPPQPFQILVMLASRPGRLVTREEIQTAVWGEETFVDFDLGLNHCIRQIRSALGDRAEDSKFIETLSRRGYRFKSPVQTKSSEVIPEAPPGDDANDSGHDSTVPSERNPDLPVAHAAAQQSSISTGDHRLAWSWWRSRTPLAAAILILGLSITLTLAVLADRGALRAPLRGRSAVAGNLRSLAVLPFENLSGDPGQEYFAAGMTDQLIIDLAQVSGLRVVSRTSVMQYAGTHKSLPQIARELNVDALVEGTAVRSGDHVRITAQLVQAFPERYVWAKTYLRERGDALSLQGELAEAIAAEIRVQLTPEERTLLHAVNPEDPQAQEAYLRGRYFYEASQARWGQDARPLIAKSISYFQRAVAIDPHYALAYAALANAYSMSAASDTDRGLATPADVSAAAKAAALRALSIDSTRAEAHTALAWQRFAFDWDWRGAELEFRQALSLNPGYVTAHHWYALFLSAAGRNEEAVHEIRMAEDLDPLSSAVKLGGGWVFYQARRYDEAIQEDKAVLELNPGSARAHDALGWAYAKRGLFAQAITEFRKGAGRLANNQPLLDAYLAHVNALSGNPREASRLAGQLDAPDGRSQVSPYLRAEIYAGLGDKARAFACLDQAYRVHAFGLTYVGVDPDLDSLRSDDRFKNLLLKVGLPN